MRNFVRVFAGVMLVPFALVCAVPVFAGDVGERETFVTTAGTGPDKWASIWLIERHLNPLEIRILPASPPDDVSVITFDFPGSRFNRTGSSSTLSALVEHFGVDNAAALALDGFITEIEFEPWETDKSIESSVLEIAFRNMQLHYGRTRVSRSCYLQFFDEFAARWTANTLPMEAASGELMPGPECLDVPVVLPKQIQTIVPEVEQAELLRKLANNEKIVFIDTRESNEFAEGHIPASINLKLREIDEASALGIPSADMVVAYCVKDFRGYEAALKLRRLGLNAVIMKPYGIRGWIAAGLPVVGPKGLTERDALLELKQQLSRYQ